MEESKMSYWKHGTLRYLLALVLVLAITASQIVPSYAETNPVSGGDSTISSSAEEDIVLSPPLTGFVSA